MAANLVVFLTVFIVATALLIAGDAVARLWERMRR